METIRIALDELLCKRNITRYEVSKRTGIKYQTIDRYYKNQVIRYDSMILYKICKAIDCGIEELIIIR